MRRTWFFILFFAFACFAGAPSFAQAQGVCQNLFDKESVIQFRDLAVKSDSDQSVETLSSMSLTAQKIFDEAGVEYFGGPGSGVPPGTLLTKEQMFFTLSTTGQHRLNKFAKSMKEKLGVTIVYSLPELVVDGVMTGGGYSRHSRTLRLNRDLPLDLKIDAVTGHEIAHAYYGDQVDSGVNSFLAGWVRAKNGTKLPMGTSKEYTSMMQFDELWTHIMHLRYFFNNLKQARTPEAFAKALRESLFIARYNQNLNSGSKKLFMEILKHEADWKFRLAARDFALLDLETPSFDFYSHIVHKNAFVGFRLPRAMEESLLAQNPVERKSSEVPQLANKFRFQFQNNILVLKDSSKTIAKIIRSLEKLQAPETTPKQRAVLMNNVDKLISELRLKVRPFIFSGKYEFEGMPK